MPRLSWAFIAPAVPLLGLVGGSAWLAVDWHLLLLAGLTGTVCLVLAGVAWLLDRMLDRMLDAKTDDAKDALAHALADITLRRGLRQTRPLRSVG